MISIHLIYHRNLRFCVPQKWVGANHVFFSCFLFLPLTLSYDSQTSLISRNTTVKLFLRHTHLRLPSNTIRRKVASFFLFLTGAVSTWSWELLPGNISRQDIGKHTYRILETPWDRLFPPEKNLIYSLPTIPHVKEILTKDNNSTKNCVFPETKKTSPSK